MHEGKHGILDDVDDMDDLFGIQEKEEDKAGKKMRDHDHHHDVQKEENK